MPISIPTLTAGTLTASAVNSIFQKLEDFINGGIDSTDFDTSLKWCKERKIVRPEFYGAPSPRTLLVSSDLHTRQVSNNLYTFVITNDISQGYVPIPGLSATIYADLNQDEGETCVAIVNSCFFCLEKEAVSGNRNSGLDDNTPTAGLTRDKVEHNDVLAATFALYVNDTKVSGTERYLYWNFDGFAFKNHSISAMITLNRGMNNVSVRVKAAPDVPSSPGPGPYNFYQVMVRERNMHIEVIYR
tara:strand:- start:101 stop:832 length:732 start_codon:yes stop_codon:yes gene_type:complete